MTGVGQRINESLLVPFCNYQTVKPQDIHFIQIHIQLLDINSAAIRQRSFSAR
jgi:hypothetical protein